jgi:hypothetical protein
VSARRQRPTVTQVVAEMGISRTCAYRWWARWRAEGSAGLLDRPSCARHHPRRTLAHLEAAVVDLRQTSKLYPDRPPRVGLPASTVYWVLCRHGRNRLAAMDRPTGEVIHRYERAHPGELVHMDVKKLGRLRDGAGHRVHDRNSIQHRCRDRGPGPGYDYVHAAIDDDSRLAYAESWPTSAVTAAPGRSVFRRPQHPDSAGADRQCLCLPP